MGLSNTELNFSCGIFNEIYGLPIYKAKNIENDFGNCRGQLVSREKKREREKLQCIILDSWGIFRLVE